MIARHVGQYGYVCPGDGVEHPAHPTRDLTLDHVLALIDGGAPFDPANTRVLCRSRNSANGAHLVNARRADRGSPHAGVALLKDRGRSPDEADPVLRVVPTDPTGWANPCHWYRDHQSKHRQTPSGWTCDACHPEEGPSA